MSCFSELLPKDCLRIVHEFAQDRDEYNDVMSELTTVMHRTTTSNIFDIIDSSNDYRQAYKLCKLYGYPDDLVELVFLIDFDIDVSEI
jgi:hypothetical protein